MAKYHNPKKDKNIGATEGKDTSIYLPHQRSRFEHKLQIRQRSDLTERQKEFLKIALDKNTRMVFLSGPAGTSKTFLSCLAALELMNMGKITDIIYIRSAVESSDHRLGYLPGDEADKLSPYIEPLMEKMDELLTVGDIKKLMGDNRLLSKPTGYLRGLNWVSKAVVCDEAQNLTYKEIVTLMTRMSYFTRLFVCADPMQNDINGKSGYLQIEKIFDNEESRAQGIHCFKFTSEDIVRSGVVRFIIDKLEQAKQEVKK